MRCYAFAIFRFAAWISCITKKPRPEDRGFKNPSFPLLESRNSETTKKANAEDGFDKFHDSESGKDDSKTN